MAFILNTYGWLFWPVVLAGVLSLLLIQRWLRALRQLRAAYLGKKMAQGARIGAIFVLMFPTLALLGGSYLLIVAFTAPCRSDYATNTTAPVASSVLLQTGSSHGDIVLNARDGSDQRNQKASVPNSPVIALTGTSLVFSSFSGPSSFSSTLANSTYVLGLHLTSTVLDLHITGSDQATGTLQWERDLSISSDSESNPVGLSRSGTHLYIHGGQTLFDLNTASGATRWQRQIGFSNGANMVVAGNVVYAPGFGENGRAALYALNAENGSLLWECHQFGFGAQFSALALYQGVLFAYSRKVFPHYYDSSPTTSEPAHAIFALKASDGSVYWRTIVSN